MATPGLDPEKVVRWLEGLDIGCTGPLTLSRIGDGKSNLTYRVDDAAGRRWILRRPPVGQVLASAHDVAREHAILQRLAPTDVSAPRPFALDTDGAACDAPLMVMEHVEGVVLCDERSAAALPEVLRHSASISLASTLATIHAVDLEVSGLADLASHAPYAPRQLKRWRRQWEASRTRDLALVEELHERLLEGAPAQQEVTLVHGDFHLLNVIVSPEDGTVLAVLDWELCTLGDPLADLGGLLAYWAQADEEVPASPFTFTATPGFATRTELADAYARASGRDLGALPYWEALACWKIAIILEGVRRRMLDDPRLGESPDAGVVTRLLGRSAELAERAGI